MQFLKSQTFPLVCNIMNSGRIYWLRNSRGATCVAPYSLRARELPRVSMPIAWSELDKIAPDGVDIAMAKKRLSKKDPWADFFEVKQVLK